MKIHCFHGFLGDSGDFDFVQNAFGEKAQVLVYDMAELCSGAKEETYSKLKIEAQDALMGYSFGARFALGAFERFNCKKLIMLGGHAGLRTAEVPARLKVEDAFVDKIEGLSFEEFVQWWNSLDLFKRDAPIDPRPWSKELMVHLFREYGLSRQKNYEKLLEQKNERVLWVCGLLDQKYLEHTRERIEPLGVKCRYIEAGHRLLQRPEQVLNIIKEELEQL